MCLNSFGYHHLEAKIKINAINIHIKTNNYSVVCPPLLMQNAIQLYILILNKKKKNLLKRLPQV